MTPEQEHMLALLRSAALLRGVPDEEIATIAARLHTISFGAGDLIVREGDAGDAWYPLAAGKAAVVSRDLAGMDITLAHVQPGDHFGEMALITGGRRSATVRALGPVTAFVLDRHDFQQVEAACPVFVDRLRRHVDVLAIDALLRKASPFARLPDATLRRLAAQLRPEAVAPGGLIVQEGAPGERFYLVRSGTVEVLRNDRRVQVLGPGDCFGEVALLAAVPRTATVRALEYTRLLLLSKAEFDAVVREDAILRRQFIEFVRIRMGDALANTIAAVDPLTTLMPATGGSRRRRYWWLLLLGMALFGLFSLIAAQTHAPLAVLGAILVGSFVGPVVYVVYLAESQLLPEQPSQLAITFVLAAVLGIPFALILEQLAGARAGHLSTALLVGLVEEPAKALGAGWLLFQSRSRFELDGLVYGAAAGMGFAAFENLAYGWATAGSVDTLLATLWVRILLSPFGHGTWTAIICAAVWRAKGTGRPKVDLPVAGALAFSVLLHALWDWQPISGPLQIVWLIVVGLVGLEVLRSVAVRANQEAAAAVLALNPEVAAAASDAPQLACATCGHLAPPGTHYCARCGAALRASP